MYRKFIFMGLFFLFFAVMVSSQVAKYKDSIPPDILKLYHQDIVNGSRPKIVTITQPMIMSLAKEPDQGGDVYRFDFDVSELSHLEKNTLLGWIKSGQKVLLWGSPDMWKYASLFSDKIVLFPVPNSF